MAEASLVEQQIAVHKQGQLKAGDGTVDCEVLGLTRRGAQLRLLDPIGGPLGGQRDVFRSLPGFGQLSCSVLDVKGDLAELRFQGDAETQDAMFQEHLAAVGDDAGRRRYLRRSDTLRGTRSGRGGEVVGPTTG